MGHRRQSATQGPGHALANPIRPAGRPCYHYGTLIQTDAKLGLGTSGGPLLNLRGEMVGLSVALAAAAGYETAGGYAIPVDATFRRAVETLKRGREVEYGFLGIQPMNLAQEEVLRGVQGMRVSQVIPGTPAARFGLRAGDVITAVDGTPLHDSDGLVLNVGKLPADAVTRLSVWRGGTIRTVSVELSKYAVRGRKIVTETDPAWRGLRVEYPTAVVDDEGRLRFSSPAVERCGGGRRSGRGLARGGGGTAARHVDHARRSPAGSHAEGVRPGRRPQSRPRSASPGRRGEEPDSHGRAGVSSQEACWLTGRDCRRIGVTFVGACGRKRYG